MSIEQIVGAGVILLAGVLAFVFGLMAKRMAGLPLRALPALDNLRRSVGLTIEDGKRLHVSLGSSSILGSGSAVSLAGLSVIEHLALLSMISDRPPLVTTGEGSLMVLGQDVLRYVYRKGNVLERYNPQLIRQTGFTPFSYIVGAMPVIQQEQVQTSVMIGRFGPEVAFLNDAARRSNGLALGATDDLSGQAVMMGTSSDILIGEELFAAPAYLSQNPFQRSSVFVQDLLRWLLIIAILAGVILIILSQFFGLSIL